MPNLPTSLILVLLAVAWLVVLVPMFARSREAVPETDDGAAGFRVLRRAGAKLRPTLHRRRNDEDEQMDDDMNDHHNSNDDADNLVEELVDGEDEFDDNEFDGDEFDADEIESDDEREVAARPQRVLVHAGVASSGTDRRGAGRPDLAGAVAEPIAEHELDAADEWKSEHRPATPSHARPAVDARSRRPETPFPDGHPVHRIGRGGFDPEHDAAAAAFRFRRRRFVTLLLLLLTLGLTAGAVQINRSWAFGAVAAGLTMVGYLFYLSRQVKIERAISERRMARLRRAKEIRPAAARQAGPESPYQQHQRPVRPAAATAATSSGDRRTSVPPAHRPGYASSPYTVVDLDDNDPAFDDLEHYEPIVYRRAAGQ